MMRERSSWRAQSVDVQHEAENKMALNQQFYH